MMKIDFFKPLNIIKCNSPYVKDRDKTQINPFFFSEWWEYCWWENQEKNKPIIFDFDKNNYYYLKSYFDGDRQKQEINFDQIFIMNKKDFESFVDNNNKLNIDKINQNEILDNIKEKTMINPPEFSLIKINKNNELNCCESETLYWSEKLFLNFVDYLGSDESIIELDERKFSLLPSLIARKNSKSTWSRKQFANGMDFCVKFLEKFYPKNVNLFLEKQNVTKEWIDKNIKGYDLDKIFNTNKIKENNELER